MAESAVVNASPLIYLARGGCFELLQVAGTSILVPVAVYAEIYRRGPGDPTVQAMAKASWITTVADEPVPALIQAWNLGAGESAVLAWAAAHPQTEAIIDDLAARRCAATIGVRVRGTLGIVLAAKQRGLVSLARPIVENLRRAGMYLSDDVMDQALALVGE